MITFFISNETLGKSCVHTIAYIHHSKIGEVLVYSTESLHWLFLAGLFWYMRSEIAS